MSPCVICYYQMLHQEACCIIQFELTVEFKINNMKDHAPWSYEHNLNQWEKKQSLLLESRDTGVISGI